MSTLSRVTENDWVISQHLLSPHHFILVVVVDAHLDLSLRNSPRRFISWSFDSTRLTTSRIYPGASDVEDPSGSQYFTVGEDVRRF